MANLQNGTFWIQHRHFLTNLILFKQKGQFWGRKKPPEAAAGHDTLVLRTKTLLASMAHECMDRTSRRAEIPSPEDFTKGGRRVRPEFGQGGKLVKKIKILKVLRMGLPIVKNLNRLQESILAYLQGPNSILVKNKTFHDFY